MSGDLAATGGDKMTVSRKLVLHFPRTLVDQPIMCRLVKEFDMEFNILKASVTPKEEGLLVVELSGTKENLEKGNEYLLNAGVEIQPLSQDVVRDEQKCTHCGACIVLCPSSALNIDRATMRVDFDDTKCIACGLCIKSCPSRAMEIHF